LDPDTKSLELAHILACNHTRLKTRMISMVVRKNSISYSNSCGFFSKTKIGDDIQPHIASLKSQTENNVHRFIVREKHCSMIDKFKRTGLTQAACMSIYIQQVSGRAKKNPLTSFTRS
jgi:hypothetical protein